MSRFIFYTDAAQFKTAFEDAQRKNIELSGGVVPAKFEDTKTAEDDAGDSKSDEEETKSEKKTEETPQTQEAEKEEEKKD